MIGDISMTYPTAGFDGQSSSFLIVNNSDLEILLKKEREPYEFLYFLGYLQEYILSVFDEFVIPGFLSTEQCARFLNEILNYWRRHNPVLAEIENENLLHVEKIILPALSIPLAERFYPKEVTQLNVSIAAQFQYLAKAFSPLFYQISEDNIHLQCQVLQGTLFKALSQHPLSFTD